jgi:hypothetical protein
MVTQKYVTLMLFIGADIFSDVQRIVLPNNFRPIGFSNKAVTY